MKKLANFVELLDTSEYICTECLGDPIARAIASSPKNNGICNFCGNDDKPRLVPAKALAKLVYTAVLERYEARPADEADRKSGFSLEEMIGDALGIKNDDIRRRLTVYVREHVLPDNMVFFASGLRYHRKALYFKNSTDESDFAVDEWNRRASSLKHHRRYFNDEGKEFFSGLFDIALSSTKHTLFGDRKFAIREVPAGKNIYRARLIRDSETRTKINNEPGTELGAPPLSKSSSFRMNPAGIPVFYGAQDIDTCISEIRPSIGDEVAVGLFVTSQDLRLFDFSRFDTMVKKTRPSILDHNYEELEKLHVLRKYINRLVAQPVRNGDPDYIMTQAMAEYLRFEAEGGFDGLIFNSVQSSNGLNYVIFPTRDCDNHGIVNQEPSFPLVLKGKPKYHHVKGVRYIGNWLIKGASVV